MCHVDVGFGKEGGNREGRYTGSFMRPLELNAMMQPSVGPDLNSFSLCCNLFFLVHEGLPRQGLIHEDPIHLALFIEGHVHSRDIVPCKKPSSGGISECTW